MSARTFGRRTSAATIAAFVTLLTAGCASTGGLAPAATLHDADAAGLRRSVGDIVLADAGFPDLAWWRGFADPQLDALVDEALRGSPSLAAADARLRRARAQAGLADAARRPAASASGQYALAQLPGSLAGDGPMHNAVLMVNFAWPLDLWGGHRADYAAALGEARAVEVEAQAARLELAAAVVRAYVGFAQACAAEDIAGRELARAGEVRRLVQQRVDAGIDGSRGLRDAEATVAAVQARHHATQQRIESARNAIAALLGAGPDRGLALERPRLLAAAPPALPASLPSDLLGRRPDVVAARWRAEAAAQRIHAAEAKFRPNVDFSGLIGLVGGDPAALFASDALLGFGGPAVTLPVFEGRRLRGELDGRDADYDLAVATYDGRVATALQQVADAVQAVAALQAQDEALRRARDAASEALALAEARQRSGVGSRLDVLAAHRPLLDLEQQLATLQAQRYLAAVDLDQALGGGLRFATPPATNSP
ncbi:efflux transporter outer membrane subunit [Arenimonas composti]|uniref:Uncharacterized protein n=1 Tax=Arenimonas composti TR7-09 = DSM 18010 TaxID=1121013 RepID=A0A091BF57_9GAMM|nr:efflux transporter outer membrane subunit [Arenimonas composti]KFN50376.1 hypothetical protein P873_06800 [Arenimonas composti TR7-09 = DSM 18010]